MSRAGSVSVRAETWVNGVSADSLPLNDRGLSYGDGLFETLRVSAGRLPLLERHLARLHRGCRVLRLFVDKALLLHELEGLAQRVDNGVIKLMLTRGGGQRGYAIPATETPTRILISSSLPEYPACRRDGVSLFPCSTRLADQPLLAGIKHLNRLEQVLARSEWDSSAFAEGLVCDQRGRPVEGTMSNLFARVGGVWVTPELQRCGVQGVMRDHLLACMAARNMPALERELSMDELVGAEEVFCCNSLFGVWPVTGLAEFNWSVGSDTRILQSLAEQVYL